MTEIDRRIADLDGLPRKNGELVFDSPAESRAFGMAVALNRAGAYDWDAFRTHLVAEVARDPDEQYYESWLHAFETLLVERGTLTADELSRRTAEFASMARDEVF
jgi:nitrile hydratase accessory protein